MPRAIPAVLVALLAWLLAGCAHQAELAETQLGPAAQVASRRPSHQPPSHRSGAPETDWRYALPPAKERSLAIFLGSQTFEYREDGRVVASGPVSSGSAEHPTPAGRFRVLSKDANKRSGRYTNYFDRPTPMPYSLQFYGPYFIHEGWLPGYADSHGCVRLRYEDARLVFHRIRVGDPVIVERDGAALATDPWPGLLRVF